MKNALVRVNRWFDHLPEGDRFLVFFSFICLPLALLLALDMRAFIAFAAPLLLMRIWWLHWR